MTARRRVLALSALAFVGTAVVAARSSVPQAPAIAPAVAPASSSASDPARGLVDDLAKLAMGGALEGAAMRALVDRLRADPSSVEAIVDELLRDRGFAHDVAVRLVLREHRSSNNPPISVTLSSRPFSELAGWTAKLGDASEPVYFLGGACAASTAELVEPWWAPGTKVRVCPSAHRPDVKGDGKYRCGSRMLAPGNADVCGCGPHLVQCARDAQHHRQARLSAVREVTDTIATTVENDEPLAQVYLRSDTVRDATTELLDRRWKIMEGEPVSIADLASFPAGTAKPRTEAFPGHHAGILTTPHMLYRVDAPRAMLRIAYELLWCQQPASANVSTEAILALKALDLRQGEGWKDLAAMPVCTTCHARLDYGVQFFTGFPSPIHGVDFVPGRHVTGEGPLYAESIDDPIGKTELTPQGFAKLAVNRDAFASCVVKNVGEHVFGASASGADREALLATFREKRTLRAVVREALIRFARARLAKPGAAVLAAAPVAPATSKTAHSAPKGELTLAPALRTMIGDRCTQCHDGTEAQDLGKPTLPRDVVVSMLGQVAFDGMPKDQPLAPEVRRAFVNALVDALWVTPSHRAEAARFFLGGMRAIRVHRPAAVLNAAQIALGDERSLPLRAIEQSIAAPLNQLTPGYAGTLGLMALDICKSKHTTRDALAACVDAMTAPESVAIDE